MINVNILKLSFSLTFKSSFPTRENESLWREVAELRAKHLKQQQVIRKVSIRHFIQVLYMDERVLLNKEYCATYYLGLPSLL